MQSLRVTVQSVVYIMLAIQLTGCVISERSHRRYEHERPVVYHAEPVVDVHVR